jgi:hypothetical protein
MCCCLWRHNVRITSVCSSGRNEFFNNPYTGSFNSHWHSCTSVFRPGMFLVSRALTSVTWIPRCDRISHSGIQYTPVDCIATVSIPHCSSQSANAVRSAVKHPKVRTGSAARLGGTAT